MAFQTAEPHPDEVGVEQFGEEDAEQRLARDLAYGQEASPPLKLRGQMAADKVQPDQDKLDEGDLEDYDQEELARGLEEDEAKQAEERREAARKDRED